MIDDLLELAEHLTRRDARRPKQSSLRRAASTAYYAVFHQLAFSCANELIGWSNPWDVVTPIYRSLDHSNARRFFDRARSEKEFGDEIATVGRIFIRLQQVRHAADYSPEPFSLSRQEVLELVGLARQAVQLVREMPSDKRKLLAVNLIARQR